ncbi:TPA: hypothetical protein CPT87_04155 [Candidatus Gastranaerophilales bacterium HUM_5]|nr:MAG TPA: hypothetical protein CPT99_05475 [Candidatus Gastranaerophilales bacterium HUM_4]DAA91229.1 MAG TPA: hypothetical protein CPT87_04155 [Candidatus Gastranaerophilales bacterium HUM_5]
MILAVSVNNTGYTNRIRAKKSEKLQNKYSTIAFKGGENPKQVAFVSFETVPINKTGGMADVVGELAPELNKRGMDVRCVIPLLNAQGGVPVNDKGQQIYRTPKGKEFPVDDLGIDFDYDYGTKSGKGKIFKVNDSRVKFPVYVLYCPDDVSNNKTEYQGWIMDQVKNQEAFCKAGLEALKKLKDAEDFNPKYVMSYEWTTAPIIEAMSKDEFYKDKIKIANINNFGPVYQGRVGAPVAAPYILNNQELDKHCAEPRVRALLEEISRAVEARAGELHPLNINEEISRGDYKAAYLKVAENYEKYIPYTTNHLGFMDSMVMDSFPKKGWFKQYYNFYVPAVRTSDSIVSCSDTYIRELAEEDRYSDGVSNLMNLERLKSFGITIGMDYSLHNPAATEKETTNPVKYPFSANEKELETNSNLLDYKTGKAMNKSYLQEILGAKVPDKETAFNKTVGARQYGFLENDPNALVSTFITRYDPQQKGVDIVIKAAEKLLEEEKDAQIILAGPDFSKDYALIKEYLENVVYKYPGRAVLCDGFINNISQFYAGSDTVLIPSRFAPFELVQLQGMRMGAIPIVSNAGGLAEIIVDPREGRDEEILGFKTEKSLFLTDDPYKSYCDTIKRALDIYKNEPATWDKMLLNGLRYKRSWDLPAQKYLETVFNPKNYSNIKDLFYIDSKFSTGEITSENLEKQREDLEYLRHKGYSQIIQIDKENKQLKNLAAEYGIKYKNIELGDTPTEESAVKLLKEIDNDSEKSFINESEGKNNKSVLACFYLAYKTLDSIDKIMGKIWTEREKDFYEVIWGDKNKIKNIMTKLSILGEKYSHDIKKLSLGELFSVNAGFINSAARRTREILEKFKELNSWKEVVYSGRHYIK